MSATVAYFTDSGDFGGAEQALLHLLGGLDRNRWRPVLLHHGAVGLAPLLTSVQKLDIESITVPPMPLGVQGAKTAPHFARVLHSLQPSIFHAHLTWPLACKYGLVAAILARVPAIVATVQLFVETHYTLSTRLQQRLLTTRIGRYIAVSNALSHRMQQTFQIPVRKIDVVYNAIPIERYQQQVHTSLDTPWGATEKRPIVLSVARLEAQKGHRYLIDAAARVPNALFVLVGEGSERSQLEAQAAALGMADRVLFLGHRQDIPELLASCDLFVLPSLYEGLPLAVLEAMAAGKPVITSAIEGTREAVNHGETGWLTPPADAMALAQAIQCLLTNPNLSQQLTRSARTQVQREFSVHNMVQKVQKIYDSLLIKRG